MRPRTRPGARTWALLGGALVVAGVATVAVPGTTSGYVASVATTSNTARVAPFFHCTEALAADAGSALFQYSFGESGGATTATDTSGHGNDGTYQGSMTTTSAAPLACPRDPGSAYVLDGATSYVSTPVKVTDPTTYSEELWFSTTVAGGRLMGFGTLQTGTSGQEDRSVYVNTAGQVVFAVYDNRNVTISTPAGTNVADGRWHHVVATESPDAGMRLYLDGTLAASDPTTFGGENDSGYWRIGYDSLAGSWPNTGTNWYVQGSMRFAAVYTTALTADQVARHYAAGKAVTGAQG